MIGRNDPCWCKSGKKWKKCHYPEEPLQSDFEKLRDKYKRNHQIILKTPEQIEGIRAASKLAAQILDKVCKKANLGTTTLELNEYAHQLHLDAGAIPAPLGYGYPPFPKSICTSLNEVICHGIPDSRPLADGDILNIDVTAILNGYYGDCSRMVMIGDVSAASKLVVEVAKECLMKSIEILRPGVLVSAIGDTIEKHAQQKSCSVVHQFVGHGVGVDFHEGPQISHNRNKCHVPLVPGMTFTIEPMINAGVAEGKIDPVDKWTARTLDGLPSAQWEHTLLITEDGCDILTNP